MEIISEGQVFSYILVPTDLNLVLEEYTQEGYRVLALAYKGLPRVSYVKVQRISREDAESNLIFLGLIIMENRLKPETTGIISMLHNASIRTIMVTGEAVMVVMLCLALAMAVIVTF
jgi:cation-transporting ATPase 13A3/4/5